MRQLKNERSIKKVVTWPALEFDAVLVVIVVDVVVVIVVGVSETDEDEVAISGVAVDSGANVIVTDVVSGNAVVDVISNVVEILVEGELGTFVVVSVNDIVASVVVVIVVVVAVVMYVGTFSVVVGL